MEFVGGCLRREVEIEFHFAAGSGGIVSKLEELTSEGSYGSLSRDRHGVTVQSAVLLGGLEWCKVFESDLWKCFSRQWF